ncbi:hypothetical protein NC653_023802 [Populus alba x Populus x berolinensis]|uniref:Uncharacterized protein n=1 Tax=Populus alba x Populus x berolinensis TaxID=444605 RepID=A0AAD6QBH1_9ROSI|nr:hypothetical protein NC653_023802 [Populus alba x Populus x berolinensis]
MEKEKKEPFKALSDIISLDNISSKNADEITLPGFHVPESPGIRLKHEGLTALHPVVLVPGIVTGGLELWEGKPCAEGLFRKRLWGGSFTEVFKRPLCLLEHLSLHNETGLDPPGIRIRAVPGLVAADYFAPGYFVWAVLIESLAKIGYEGKNMHMAAYDWRLSFQNTEIREQTLSRLRSQIELMNITNGYKKVVMVPHSMGVIYFLHFLKWVEAPPPMGGGGGPGWCAKHIKAIMNIGPVFLGVPKTISNLLSAEAKDVASTRAMDPGVLDSEILGLQTLEHVMRVTRTWDSMASLLPKGGETIWGNLDWSPEEGHACDFSKKRYSRASAGEKDTNGSDNNLNEQHKGQSWLFSGPRYRRVSMNDITAGHHHPTENLGFTSYPPAYLSKKARGKNLLIGANFASAASGYYETTAKLYHAIPLSQQLGNYKEYQNKIVGIAGKSNASSIISGAIYLISAGSSDFVQNYYINPLLYKVYTPEQFSDLLIQSYTSFIEDLYKLGARKIGVTSLPPLGCLPATVTIFGSDSNECVAKLNKVAVSFNNKLNSTSQSLVNKLSGLNLLVFDIYQPLYDLVTKPADFGISSINLPD